MDKIIPESLTPRQTEVLNHIKTGATNREIAERLHISERTVESHASTAFDKLGFKNRVEYLAWLTMNLND